MSVTKNKKVALISVYDKTGVVEFTHSLLEMDYMILASGGTYNLLYAAFKKQKHKKLSHIVSIDSYTSSPEILGGRVKTLHPKIHGGILAQRNLKSDIEDIDTQKMKLIDVVAVTLYPFEDTIAKKDVTIDKSIEQIDIGGVTLLRAASKNYRHVLCVSDPKDYNIAIQVLNVEHTQDKNTRTKVNQDCMEYRKHFASKSFSLTAHYESCIAQYMNIETSSVLPDLSKHTDNKEKPLILAQSQYKTLGYKVKEILRYGENPHQSAILYTQSWPSANHGSLVRAKQLHGKVLSFNNIKDTEAAISIVKSFVQDSMCDNRVVVVGVKHGNPCGVALSDNTYTAWSKCYKADSISIFGGIVALSEEVDGRTAKSLSKIFLEIIIAPKFSKEALEILKKKKNIRLLQLKFTKDKSHCKRFSQFPIQQYSSIEGGLLSQDKDLLDVSKDALRVVTKKKPTSVQIDELLFAWKVCKYVKSNAIVLSKSCASVGIGAGQMNRIGAAAIALEQASTISSTKGMVLASDAFFPMPDTVELAAKYGVAAIIQPGGSIKDQDSIDACNLHKISMVFTGIRHFLH